MHQEFFLASHSRGPPRPPTLMEGKVDRRLPYF